MEIEAKYYNYNHNAVDLFLSCSWRLKRKEKSYILSASCRNYEDYRLQADVLCYPETSDN